MLQQLGHILQETGPAGNLNSLRNTLAIPIAAPSVLHNASNIRWPSLADEEPYDITAAEYSFGCNNRNAPLFPPFS